jgi:hypothetical protein
MKKFLCTGVFFLLAVQPPLWCYDSSPAWHQFLPEAIWAPATGGGTWITEVQITSYGLVPATINVYFHYSGGARGSFQLYAGLAQYETLRYSNILATIDALDTGPLVYYGKVGAVWFTAGDMYSKIMVQAKTVNGNYGKTLPAVGEASGNFATLGRNMVIQDLVQDSTYRTFVGFFNPSGVPHTIQFRIVDADNNTVGGQFTKTIQNYGYTSFNPFVEAGVPAGVYSNCWLYINVTAGQAVTGVLGFGSIANNYTNDTYALIARQYQ